MIPRSSDVPLADRLTTGDARKRATGHLPSSAPQAVALALPDRLRRPRSERQMRLAEPLGSQSDGPAKGSPAILPTTCGNSRLNPLATGFRGPTRLPLSSFTYS